MCVCNSVDEVVVVEYGSNLDRFFKFLGADLIGRRKERGIF